MAIDIADRDTWPASIRKQVDEWARGLRGTTRYTSDLAVPLEAERPFLELLRGHRLVAYHFTRLLEHERVNVQTKGMPALTAEFVDARIRRALEARAISETDAQALLGQHFFARPPDGSRRAGQVCFHLTDHIITDDPKALGHLMTLWGGEAIFKPADESTRDIVRGLGVPSVLTAFLDVSDPNCSHRFAPSLPKVFVGRALTLKDATGDVFYRADVPPQSIHRIAQPGHPWYDSYRSLPRI